MPQIRDWKSLSDRRRGQYGLPADDGFYYSGVFSLFTVFNARSDERSAFVGLFSNQWLWGAVLLSLLLQAAVITSRSAAGIFDR